MNMIKRMNKKPQNIVHGFDFFLKKWKPAHTCLIALSALFRQNHHRPDFFGIFSFTQASSVALNKKDIQWWATIHHRYRLYMEHNAETMSLLPLVNSSEMLVDLESRGQQVSSYNIWWQ